MSSYPLPFRVGSRFVSPTKRNQINLYYSYLNPYITLNILKIADTTMIGATSDSGSPPWAARMDVNGYLTSTGAAAIQNQCRIPQDNYSGYWVFKWTGDAGNGSGSPTFAFSDAITISDISASASAGATQTNSTSLRFTNGVAGENRVAFKITPVSTAPDRITITNNTTCTNFVFVTGDPSGQSASENVVGSNEELLSRGFIYNPTYLNAIRDLNVKTLRMVQVGNSEVNVNGDYFPEASLDSYAWGTGRFDPRLYWGDTTNTGNAYSLSTPPSTYPGGFPSTPTNGTVVQFRLNASSSSGDKTLELPGWGPKLIHYIYSLNTNGGAETGLFTANRLITLTYFDNWTGSGGAFSYFRDSSSSQTLGLGHRFPPLAQIAMGNETGCDVWINFPATYGDGAIYDMLVAIANYMRPGLKCKVEVGNEVWNSIYYNTTYARFVGSIATGLSDSDKAACYNAWYSLRTAQTARIIDEVCAATGRARSDFVLIGAAFMLQYSSAEMFAQRYEGEDLGTVLGPGGETNYYNTAPNRMIDVIDEIAYADYLQGSQFTLAPATVSSSLGSFTASCSGTTMTVTAYGGYPFGTSRGLGYGGVITGGSPAFTVGTTILSQLTSDEPGGTLGKTGTYEVSISQEVSSAAGRSATIAGAQQPYLSPGPGAYATFQTHIDAMEDYASGDPARIQEAFDAIKADIESPATISGITNLGLDNLYNATGGIYETFNDYATTHDKPVSLYEGGIQITPIYTATWRYLGLDSSTAADYQTKSINLINAFFHSDQCEQLTYDKVEKFMSHSKSSESSWYCLDNGEPFAMFHPDFEYENVMLVDPRTSFDGYKRYNRG